MEYHKDRFEDYSLLFFDDKNQVKAVFPANKSGEVVFSHQGLTYGGLVFSKKNKAEETEQMVQLLLDYLTADSVKKIIVKLLPSLYNQLATNDFDYFIYQKGGVLFRRDMNLAINLKCELQISKSKLKHFRRVSETGLTIVQESDFSNFWNLVLIPRLNEKHQASPVHTLAEIHYLTSKFPNNIRQYSVYEEDEIIAGITVFESDYVVKSQYGATTKRGETTRALDFLFIHLIEKYKNEGKSFFDMGIVNENEGKIYNKGLISQKEELGCTVYNQDFYTILL
ncbi:hypothetical protein GCM10011343_18010 [Flavobacterium orientale]|uniref:Acetyltransferase (GNAT) domain-containing protein n=2 Tax=Flavobacterium orientale TaxID=1756020 RepID=A0A916Y3B9_9FLAO|nr:hypothetical protein GCM10011343_18010 [Flavobacterium orientale]